MLRGFKILELCGFKKFVQKTKVNVTGFVLKVKECFPNGRSSCWNTGSNIFTVKSHKRKFARLKGNTELAVHISS